MSANLNPAIKAHQTIKDKSGDRPIHRPKEWWTDERIEEKEKKKKDWYNKGGLDSFLFAPSTLDGKLKKMYEHAIRKAMD